MHRGDETIPGLGVLVTFEQIFSQRARHEDLKNYIARFTMAGFIGMICGIAAILHTNDEPRPFALQRRFGSEFAKSSSTAKRVLEKLRREQDAVFVHDEQLAVLVKYALLYARADSWPNGEAADLLMRILLVFNSLHGTEQSKGDALERMVRLELRSTFNFTEHFGRLIRRYGAFFDWARSNEDALKSENRLDIDADFKRFTGMRYLEWAASAFAVLSYFRQITSAKAMETTKPIMDVEGYLAPISADAQIRSWIAQNKITIAKAIACFEQQMGEPSYAGVSLLPFIRRPLLELKPGFVCVPYLPHLENALGTGIFFALLDGYNKHDGKSASDRFTRFFGEFCEDYAVELFRNGHPDPSRIFGELPYEKGKRSSDVVIFEGDSAIFVDVSSSRLNMKKTLIDLDAESVAADIKKIVVDNAEQLDKSIRAFREGRLAFPGIDTASIKKIHPVILTPQALPRGLAFNAKAMDEVRVRGLLTDVEPLEMMTAEEAELVCRLYAKGGTLSDLLTRKASHSHPKARGDSIKNYLFYFEGDTLANLALTEEYDGDKWIADILDLVKTWMDQEAAAPI